MTTETYATPATSDARFVPNELGWAWAACLQLRTGGLWLVLWEPGGQHFTAFYRGHTGDGGAYQKAWTPRGLWLRILVFDPQRPHLDVDDNADDPRDVSAWQPDIRPTRLSIPLRRAELPRYSGCKETP